MSREPWIDSLSRLLARDLSRRQVARAALGGAVATLFASLVPGRVGAAAGAIPAEVCDGLVCPADMTQDNDPDQCGAVVQYRAPSALGDTCGRISCSPASGSSFPVGTTSVTCVSVSSDRCTFTVTVQDIQPPNLGECPAEVRQEIGVDVGRAAVTFPTPTAGDNCREVSVTCSPPSGSAFPRGTTPVICTATDGASNRSLCAFNVVLFSASDTVDVGADPGDTVPADPLPADPAPGDDPTGDRPTQPAAPPNPSDAVGTQTVHAVLSGIASLVGGIDERFTVNNRVGLQETTIADGAPAAGLDIAVFGLRRLDSTDTHVELRQVYGVWVQIQPIRTPNRVNLSIRYGELELFGAPESNLRLFYYHDDLLSWVEMPSFVDIEHDTILAMNVDVSAFADRLHRLGLFI